MFNLDKNYLYAIIGATTNKEKYGYKVLMNLKQKGFRVVGINPKYQEIEGIKCYPALKFCPQKIDVAVFVINPQIGQQVITQCLQLGINKIWLQPGSESKQIIEFAKQNKMDIIYNACIMKESEL